MNRDPALSRERIEELDAFWIWHKCEVEEVKPALRELLHLREQVEALREYVEHEDTRFDIKKIGPLSEFERVHREWNQRRSELRARIGRREDGTWEER